uniref:G-protein coupled receptors family 1 profile domain-containing protein n=1 Tax=Acrobeloides nanus TaxID=290746 RepID=A0A914CLB8_9BILA
MTMSDLTQNGSPSGNWAEIQCEWFDEVYEMQNNLYWRHLGAGSILILYALVCTFGALANFFVILCFLRTSRLRNLRNYFIVNLAVSDLLLCVITAPSTVYFTLNLFWPFGDLACQATASLQAVNMFVSCLTLVLIAMDRFLLTLCPIQWKLAAKAPFACYSIVWLMSILVAAPYFFAVSAVDVKEFYPWDDPYTEIMLNICHTVRPQMCLEKSGDLLPFSRKAYTLTVLAIQYILPLAALGFAYSQIGSTIRKRSKFSTTLNKQRRNYLNQKNRKAMLLLLLLVIVYAIAWLPINAYNVLNVLDLIKFSQFKYIFCHLIGMTSACVNPIMYALINDSFRKAFLSMLRPLFGLCTKYIAVSPPQHTMYSYSHMNGNGTKKGESPHKKPIHDTSEEAQRTPLITPTPVTKSPTREEVSKSEEQNSVTV